MMEDDVAVAVAVAVVVAAVAAVVVAAAAMTAVPDSMVVPWRTWPNLKFR